MMVTSEGRKRTRLSRKNAWNLHQFELHTNDRYECALNTMYTQTEGSKWSRRWNQSDFACLTCGIRHRINLGWIDRFRSKDELCQRTIFVAPCKRFHLRPCSRWARWGGQKCRPRREWQGFAGVLHEISKLEGTEDPAGHGIHQSSVRRCQNSMVKRKYGRRHHHHSSCDVTADAYSVEI